MSTNAKTVRPEAAETACPATEAFSKGVQAAAKFHKSTLDMVVQQNAETVEACKRAIKATPFAQAAPLFDLAAQMVEKYAGLQKNIMDLMLDQTAAMMQINVHREPSKTTGALAGMFRQSVERSVTAQKMALDVAAQQNKAMAETVKQQVPAAAAAADSIQHSLDALIETQKNVLDIASQPLKAAAAV